MIKNSQEKANYLHRNLQKLEDCIKNDTAKGASTMLHSIRKRLNELTAIRIYLFEFNEITYNQSEDLELFEKELRKQIHELLQERIIWHSKLMDKYLKDIITTPLIVANVYNDIIDDGIIFQKEIKK